MKDLQMLDNGVLARTELDMQISTAKAYPRRASTSMERATALATMDEETAQSCFYCLPRKEKDGSRKEIKGASIRLAEIVASSWGNLHAATRIVENDGKTITAEGVAWDLETNVKIAVQNRVSIVFGQKNGQGGYQASADMQTMLANAASAKALRNAIFKVVPKALVDRVLDKAMKYSVGDQSKIGQKVYTLFDKLGKMGLGKDAILAYYGRANLSDITPDDYQSLIGLGTAIKEGFIKIDEVFAQDAIPAQSAAEHINSLISAGKQKSIDKNADFIEDMDK